MEQMVELAGTVGTPRYHTPAAHDSGNGTFALLFFVGIFVGVVIAEMWKWRRERKG